MSTSAQQTIQLKHDDVLALCRRYGVASLDLFGSGARNDWEPDRSDLDFLVTFHERADQSLADRYLGLAQDLERLFGVNVELLTRDSIRNPYLLRTIEATRTTIYAE